MTPFLSLCVQLKETGCFRFTHIAQFLLGKSKEAEVKRINKELANIRSKFKGDKTLDGYQKKKYVCKLLFIFLLGHDIDFGHMEAVNLLSSNKYSEKQIVSDFKGHPQLVFSNVFLLFLVPFRVIYLYRYS